MNEREFMLRMVIALANKSGYNEFERAKEFAAEARKRGLFEAAPLTPTGAERLAQAERDLGAAKALLREMAAHFAGSAAPMRVSAFSHPEWAEHGESLIARAKEMTND